ncbi:MAG: hypothetical protein HY720_16640 [Planctomycetes bacterium]|nr:hypothetical protein [Planctomycetota bacterium]
MEVECLFAEEIWSAPERAALAGRIAESRENVARWLAGQGLDPDRLAAGRRPVVIVYPAGPPSHVTHEDGHLHLLWPRDRTPPLVHEWVHAFSPGPAGVAFDEFLREGIATWLQERLSRDPVFPLGRSSLAGLARRFGPREPLTEAAVLAADRAFAGRLFSGELDSQAARWRTYVYAGLFTGWLLAADRLPARAIFNELLGHSDVAVRLEHQLGRSLAVLLGDFGRELPELGEGLPDPDPPREALPWFERWRALPWT